MPKGDVDDPIFTQIAAPDPQTPEQINAEQLRLKIEQNGILARRIVGGAASVVLIGGGSAITYLGVTSNDAAARIVTMMPWLEGFGASLLVLIGLFIAYYGVVNVISKIWPDGK